MCCNIYRFSLVAWDLTTDQSCSSSHLCLTRSGSMRLEINFATPLAAAIVLVVYSEFDNILTITKDRDVALDYSC